VNTDFEQFEQELERELRELILALVASVHSEDLWDAWAFAEDDARAALRAWEAAPESLKADRYAAYRAALDREERAAVLLAASRNRRRELDD
jgi:hypothetical protein